MPARPMPSPDVASVPHLAPGPADVPARGPTPPPPLLPWAPHKSPPPPPPTPPSGSSRDELSSLATPAPLAWGSVHHPPLSIAVLALVRAAFGDSLIALRAVPVLA